MGGPRPAGRGKGAVGVPGVRVLGIPVRVHASLWLFLAALAAWGQLGRGAALAASILVHELAHGWCARRLGVGVYQVELWPFGGVVRVDEPALLEPAREAAVAVAGPLAHAALALAAVAARAAQVAGDGPVGGWLQLWVLDQVALALFNLLPAYPLDGGRVLRAWLASRQGVGRATGTVVQLGRWMGGAMVVLGWIAYGAGWMSPWAMAMGVLVAYAAGQQGRRAASAWVQYLDRLQQAPPASVREVRALAARYDAPLKEVTARWVPGRYHLVLVTGPRGELRGLVGERAVVETFLSHGPYARLAQAGPRSL